MALKDWNLEASEEAGQQRAMKVYMIPHHIFEGGVQKIGVVVFAFTETGYKVLRIDNTEIGV